MWNILGNGCSNSIEIWKMSVRKGDKKSMQETLTPSRKLPGVRKVKQNEG